jgi:bacterioferritin (cytochrome b1)
MSTKDVQEKIIANMRRWQKIEDAAVAHLGQIISKTDNSVIRMIMEIILHDSQTHRRVQELIVNTLTETVSLTPDDLVEVWDMIERHIKYERETIDLAKMALEDLQGKKMVVQEYLINYLLEDEKKHDKLLETLKTIKKGMYPYG